ncbi:MAG: tyrosine-type recombinase/integrase [Actinomycetota bacterium]|nr:tyrosine-type recombinase/integrase [Actinomycetota bacterium]
MDLIGRHLTHLTYRNLRPGTIDQRRRALRRLARHLGDRDLLTASTDDLVAFLDRPLQPEARATEISHLRGFYRWAIFDGLVRLDPTMRLVRPRLPRRLPRPMPDGDLAMALELAPERVGPILHLAAYAGLRACEISGLRGDHVLLDQDPPLLLVAEGKGGGMSSVPLAPVLVDLLVTMPRRGWLFPRFDSQPGPTPPHRISQLANRYLHGIGVDHSLHTCRHWFGSHAYRTTGRDLRATQELLRHRSPISTAIYTFVDPGPLVHAVAALPIFSSEAN